MKKHAPLVISIASMSVLLLAVIHYPEATALFYMLAAIWLLLLAILAATLYPMRPE